MEGGNRRTERLQQNEPPGTRGSSRRFAESIKRFGQKSQIDQACQFLDFPSLCVSREKALRTESNADLTEAEFPLSARLPSKFRLRSGSRFKAPTPSETPTGWVGSADSLQRQGGGLHMSAGLGP